MKTIGATKFREQCLAILDGLEPEGLIGSLAGKIEFHGDLLSTGTRWGSGC